jgi:hypothetical protein
LAASTSIILDLKERQPSVRVRDKLRKAHRILVPHCIGMSMRLKQLTEEHSNPAAKPAISKGTDDQDTVFQDIYVSRIGELIDSDDD